MQRLKGLTTGSLPTFMDVGNNFASDQINEDNVLFQARASGFGITQMGDDTWLGLFPTVFNKSYPYPSFDVWDLDTVDNGVEQHLHDEIKAENWNVLIAHCLGVDHCGHRYGPHHSEMKRKLLQMNTIIQQIIASMDNSTILLVMGDHGMTQTGDHGGDSPDEVTAAFFSYSHQWKVQNIQNETSISQVDLVPTLALLLGMPIPFSNLGSANLDLLYPDHIVDSILDKDHAESVAKSYLCDALFLNVKQVWRYLEAYNQEKPLPDISHFEQMYRDIVALYNSFEDEPTYKSCLLDKNRCGEAKDHFIIKSKTFLKEVKDMCSAMWANFDVVAMVMGLLVFLVAVMANYVAFSSSPTCIGPKFDRFYWSGIAIVSLSLTSQVLNASFIFFTAPIVFMVCVIFIWKICDFQKITWRILCLVIPSLMAVLYTSNSFVVEEPYLVHFATQSLIWWPFILRKRKQTSYQWFLRIVLSVSTRLGLELFRCREEQLPACVAHQLHRSLSSLSRHNIYPAIWRLFLALSSCSFIVIGFCKFLQVSTSIVGLWILVCAHWLTEFLSFLNPEWIHPSMLLFFPRIFYAVFVISLLRQIYQILHRKTSTDYRKDVFQIVAILSSLGSLLAGDGLTPAIGLILICQIIVGILSPQENEEILWPLYGCLSLHGFFATGHHTSLAAIPWEAAFVGLSQSGGSNAVPVLLVSYSTAFSALIHPVALLALLWTKKIRNDLLERSWLYLLLFYSIRVIF